MLLHRVEQPAAEIMGFARMAKVAHRSCPGSIPTKRRITCES
jgi:hypothetical protein